MLKEAIEKICELATPKTYTVGDRTFYDAGRGLTEVRPEVILTPEKKLTSLDALVTLVKTEALKLQQSPLYIQADSFDHVSCFTQPGDEKHEFLRTRLYQVGMTDVPGFREGFMGYEQAMITLRCAFQDNTDLQYLINLLSRIDVSAAVTTTDNGLSQQVETQNGIALKDYENVRPVVNLKPYRTFQEVDQPETAFLCRINDKCQIGLFEADGGMWKLKARENVKDFLAKQLQTEVDAKQVYITL